MFSKVAGAVMFTTRYGSIAFIAVDSYRASTIRMQEM